MSKMTDKYVATFESFLERVRVSGEYFCDEQKERWLGQVRDAAERAASASASDRHDDSIGALRK